MGSKPLAAEPTYKNKRYDLGKFNRPIAFLVIVNDAIDPAADRIASHQPSAGFNNLDTAAMSVMPGSSQTS